MSEILAKMLHCCIFFQNQNFIILTVLCLSVYGNEFAVPISKLM